MAYFADDTFLPSWGSGMRPREPIDPQEEDFSGHEHYPPKPKNLKMGTPPGSFRQMDQLTPYGTMDEPATASGWCSGRSARQAMRSPAPPVPVAATPLPNHHFMRLRPVKKTQKSLFLLFWPSFLGIWILIAFGLTYWHHMEAAKTVLLFVLTFGSLLIAMGACTRGVPGKASRTFFVVNGICVMFVATLSVLLGIYCFQTYMKSFEIYSKAMVYNGVAPNINPGAHRDAGVINFADGAFVDGTKSIGIRNGDIYCAAPIMPRDIREPAAQKLVGFWAVGINCCISGGRSSKSDFRCGEDRLTGNGHSKKAGSGLVVLDENAVGIEEIPMYMKAVKLSSQAHDIKSASKPIFVKLSADVAADRDQYHSDAISFVYAAATGLFVFMLAVVSTLSLMSASNVSIARDYYNAEVDDIDEMTEKIWVKKKGRKADNFPNIF